MADQIAKRREHILSVLQDVVHESGNSIGFDAAIMA